MGSEWKKYRLVDIVKLRNGAGVKQIHFTDSADGIPLAKVSNFTSDSIDVSGMTKVNVKHSQEWKTHILETDDVVIATVGSWPPNWSSVVGKVIRVPKVANGFIQNQNTCCLLPTSIIDKSYLFYLLKTNYFSDWVVNIAQGSANQARVPVKKLGEYEVLLPSISKQREIGSHLKNLDDKITLNRQINQTLEQMAQTLFKSWFVDFDPVIDNALDAIANGQNIEIPESLAKRFEARKAVRESEGFEPLPADIRQLFPCEFEESELGFVPKGWGVEAVSEAININPRVKLSKGSEAKFVDMKALPTTGYSVDEIGFKAYSGGAKFNKNDVLLARITPCLQNGKTGFVDFLEDDEVGFGSTEFIVLRETESIHYGYVACLARNDIFRTHVMQSMVGSSGRQRVQNGCFNDYFIAIPDMGVMDVFADISTNSFNKMKVNQSEIETLTKLRDTLLPKLISGELRLDSPQGETLQQAVSAE